MTRSLRFALLATTALAFHTGAMAQTQSGAGAPVDSVALLRQRLAGLQQQASADPALRPAQDSFQTVVNAAMARLDPAAPAKLAQAASVNARVSAAQAAHDNAGLNQLADEATALQAYFAALRPRAMAEADVAAARAVWLARLFEAMKRIDPNAQQYVDRLVALTATPGSASH
jgi:hypothetical protein